MKIASLPLAALLAAGCVSAPAGPTRAGHAAVLDEVIAAERAFAAETRSRGFKPGFLAWVAANGFVFQPGPVPALPGLEALPDAPPPGPPLFWWPQWAGVSLSGDLGFTTGGATTPVRYFTVWQRQADGSWRWLYDGGPALDAIIPETPGVAVSRLAPATATAGSAARALAELAPIEAELAARARSDAVAARRQYLAEDGLVAGSRTASFPGRESQSAELDRQPARFDFRPISGVASATGDLAFTWGEARWEAEGRRRWGHYARIWQDRREGWRLIAEILVTARGEPPA